MTGIKNISRTQSKLCHIIRQDFFFDQNLGQNWPKIKIIVLISLNMNFFTKFDRNEIYVTNFIQIVSYNTSGIILLAKTWAEIGQNLKKIVLIALNMNFNTKFDKS